MSIKNTDVVFQNIDKKTTHRFKILVLAYFKKMIGHSLLFWKPTKIEKPINKMDKQNQS